MLHLEFPEKRHEKMWRDIVAEFEAKGEKTIPYALTLKLTDYDAYLAKTNDFHNNANVPEELVQQTTYFLLDEKRGKILGAVNIRHRLNDYLLYRGGHIGYGIAPSERRKGYATKMLALVLDECRELGLKQVLLTCDKSNIASAKTILKNGGILDNEEAEEDGNIFQRYWVDLSAEKPSGNSAGSIDDYIAQFPPDVREKLDALRAVIGQAAPDASERISYQMPTFYLQGNLVHFASYQHHIGFYPAPSGIEAFKQELAEYKSSKGAVQFPLDKPLPYELISEIVKFRVAENMKDAVHQ